MCAVASHLSSSSAQRRWTGWSRWQLRGLSPSRPPPGPRSALSSPGWTCEPRCSGPPSQAQVFSEEETHIHLISWVVERFYYIHILGCGLLESPTFKAGCLKLCGGNSQLQLCHPPTSHADGCYFSLIWIKQKIDRNPCVTFRLQGCLSSTCRALGDEEAFGTRQRGEEDRSGLEMGKTEWSKVLYRYKNLPVLPGWLCR